MNNACPSCGTVYTVTPADVGRRIACAKCATALRVAAAGLEREPAQTPGSAGAATPATEPAAPARSRQLPPIPTWATTFDPPTLLFSAGILVMLYFAFGPVIAAAKVERRSAQLSEASLDHAVRVRALQEKKADEKLLKDTEDRWAKQRDEYQDAVKYAELGKQQAAYWDRHGMLAGYLLIAAGGVWLLRTEQPLVKRVVAAVVVTVQVILAFQTVTPVGCAPAARAYNHRAPAPAELEPRP